jgi:hypothetical protein
VNYDALGLPQEMTVLFKEFASFKVTVQNEFQSLKTDMSTVLESLKHSKELAEQLDAQRQESEVARRRMSDIFRSINPMASHVSHRRNSVTASESAITDEVGPPTP